MPNFDRSKPILVFLAGGVQGGAVVRALLRHGLQVRAMVRDRQRASALKMAGVELFEGDLDDSASLVAVSRNVSHAVLQVPTGPREVMHAQAEKAVAALQAEAVSSIILKLASASRHEPCEEPSFVANALIEDVVRQAHIPYATIRPTMYLDNLLKSSAREEIVEQGVFSPPIATDQRVAWTSAADCAEAAVTLLKQGVDGCDHRIAGPESLTGYELAERITSGLGQSVIYRAQPIEEFERDVDAAMGKGVGRRVASKFRYFAAHPTEADDILARSFEPKSTLVGFQPMYAETWVKLNRSAFLSDAPTHHRQRSGVTDH